MELFKQDTDLLKEMVKSYRYTDADTVKAINDIYAQFNYVACPHTAIAWLAIQEYSKQFTSADDTFVFLSTAHPCKFPDIFPAEIAASMTTPSQVEELKTKERSATKMNVDFDAFKEFLLASV